MSHRQNRNFPHANRNTAGTDNGIDRPSGNSKPCREPAPYILTSFESFQKAIDAKNDKWERLVKCSRDVTIESKRVIFLLHRVTRAGENIHEILQETQRRLVALREEKFRFLATELLPEDHFQFMYPVKPGIQEFIEALTFLYYLQHDQLMSYEKVKEFLKLEPKPGEPDIPVVTVTIEDYLLGLADVSGELMRLSINYISSGDFDKQVNVVHFLRGLYSAFTSVGRQNFGSGAMAKDFASKTHVMKQSLAKVENACYVLKLRGTEIPKHMLVDAVAFFVNQQHPNESYCDET